METILSALAGFVINIIEASSYWGIVILMAMESACIPIPSEVIMPFSGYLVFKGELSFWLAVIWGAIGNLIGSIIAYWIGYYGGRSLIERYGKYILISQRDLELADKWFYKYGQGTVFFSRLLPIVRTFISLPAGIARMDFKKFSFYTLAGCLPWSFVLTYAGVILGENWKELEKYFREFQWIIGGLIVVGVIFWVWRHLRR